MTRLISLAALLSFIACTADVPTGPAEPATLAVFEAPPAGTPGWLLDNELAVKVADASGNPVPGVSVAWQAEASGALLENGVTSYNGVPNLVSGWGADGTTTTDESGVARIRYVPGWASGTQRVTAHVGAISAAVSIPVSTSRLTSVAIGAQRACGIDEQGALFCWVPAWRPRHEGPTTLPASMRPVAANTTERFLTVTGGADFSANPRFCALTTAGAVRCFTATDFNAAGVVTPLPLASPVPFVSLTATTFGPNSLAWACGLDASGQAWCQGNNSFGALGDGTTISRQTFAPVAGGVRYSRLLATYSGACGLDLGGELYCWGQPLYLTSTLVPTARAPGFQFSDVGWVPPGVCGIAAITSRLECLSSNNSSAPQPFTPSLTVHGLTGNATSSGQALLADGQVVNWGDQVPFDLFFVSIPEAGAGLTGFDALLSRGTAAACAHHITGSTVCSWVFYRGVGVPTP